MIGKNLVDRYVSRTFLKPLGLGIAVFTLLVVVGHLIEKINTFTEYQASARDIALYIVYGIPFWIDLIAPVATLLATLFSLNLLQQRGEITAFKACGIAPLRVSASLFGWAALLSLASFVAGQSVVPQWNLRSRYVYRVNIKKQSFSHRQQDRVVVAGREGRRYTVEWMDADSGYFRNLVVDRFDSRHRQVEQVAAPEASYDRGRWTLVNGVHRRFEPATGQVIWEKQAPHQIVTLPETPEEIHPYNLDVRDLNLKELSDRMRKLERMGFPVEKEQVAWHLKWSLPCAHLIVVALGIPFALRPTRSTKMKSFTFALVVAFFYWGTTSVGQSLAETRAIPAWLGAWLANFIFGSLGAYRLSRIPS